MKAFYCRIKEPKSVTGTLERLEAVITTACQRLPEKGFKNLLKALADTAQWDNAVLELAFSHIQLQADVDLNEKRALLESSFLEGGLRSQGGSQN